MKDSYVDVEHWATISLMPWVVDGRANEWLITGVNVQYAFRGQGWASRLFDQVVADADAEGATLILNVDPDGTGLGLHELRAFYGRRDFRPWGPDPEHIENGMRRDPRTVEPSYSAPAPAPNSSACFVQSGVPSSLSEA